MMENLWLFFIFFKNYFKFYLKVSEINSEGTTTGTSSSVQFKRENTEDLSTVVSFEGDFVGKDKEGNLEISVEVNIQVFLIILFKIFLDCTRDRANSNNF